MKHVWILLAAVFATGGDASAAPNILFCIADDASPHFGIYGCKWAHTPNIDRLAARGLVFDQAFTPTAKCAPSRAAILTGRNPWQLEAAANHMCFFPPQYKAFSEVLHDAGVQVGSLGKVWGPGVAETAEGQPRDWGIAKSKARGKNTGAALREFLASRPKDKPFFYWFGSVNPHRPYKPDSGLAAGKKPGDIDRVPAFWPDCDVVRRDMLDYAVEIESFDAEVGSLLTALEESGEAENTLVIVTSDHGMPFPRSKGNTYEISNHVPLVACWPKGIVNPGRRVADLVSFIDLTPTFLELNAIQADASGMAPLTGQSFADLLRDQPQRKRPWVLVGRERNDWGRPNLQGYPVRGIVQDHFLLLLNLKPDRWPACNPEADYPDTDNSPTKKLITDGQENPELRRYWQLCFGLRGPEELYHLEADHDCIDNLALDASQQSRKAAMKKLLLDQLKAQGDPRIVGDGDVFDRYPASNPDWAGKFERLPDEPKTKSAKRPGK